MRLRVGPTLVLSSLALLAPAARADEPTHGWSTFFLEPALSGDGALGVEASRTLGDEAFSTGIVLGYVTDPLVLLANPDAPDQSDLHMLETQIALDYVVAVGFGRRFQVGAGLPLALSQSGDFDDVGPGPSSTALGDVRAELKYVFVSNEGDGPGLALAPQVIFPSGDEESFLGEEGIAFHPRLLADFRLGRLGAFGSLGAKFRTSDGQLGELSSYSHELTWGAALSLPIPGLRDVGALLVEYRGATQLSDPFGVAGANPAEVDGALRYLIEPVDLTLTGGAGAGVTTSAGAPGVRAFLGVSWRPTEHDEDGDAISDGDDECPQMPEDGDEFEDSDGCPEPDNDGDHVDDGADRCPNEPEDIDQVADDDGCPDPDADQDGVPDATDRCADQVEDQDDHDDDDGCLDADNDGDGVLDTADRCANEAEDVDQFQDDDGCPEADNDSDGRPDADDRCPIEGEDVDQFQDEDGCPDIDNDHDGVLDATDTCGDRPETINGTTDEDGCPDAGAPPLARIVQGVLRITGALAFGPNDQPTPATRRVLDQLAHVLIANHPVSLSLASRGANAEQGAARAGAVRQYLLSKGVPAASAGTVTHEATPAAQATVVPAIVAPAAPAAPAAP